MKNISIIGSTGSIGTQTLEVIAELGIEYNVIALAAGSNYLKLAEQVKQFKPELAVLNDKASAVKLSELLTDVDCQVYHGTEGLLQAATWPSADIIVLAQSGAGGFHTLVAALQQNKIVALSNKESLVIGGETLERMGLLNRQRIYPLDSEHSAIWQCIGSLSSKDVSKIYLTASGGPFLGWNSKKMKEVTPEMALKHPNWKMGEKITVDSATLMNKGLEVIEAKWLFNLSLDQIQVVIHPQSIIHSMVEFIDGSIIAQLGEPQMHLPIHYALAYPGREKSSYKRFNPIGKSLDFMAPDAESFPSLGLAYRASRIGGTMPAVLNAANEKAVEIFLESKIYITDIPALVEATMNSHSVVQFPTVSDIIKTDLWARQEAKKLVDEIKRGR